MNASISRIKKFLVALSCGAIPFVTEAACDPYTGAGYFFRDDDSGDYYDDYYYEDYYFDYYDPGYCDPYYCY